MARCSVRAPCRGRCLPPRTRCSGRARGPGRLSRAATQTSPTDNVMTPPCGIASRAFNARLIIAVSSCVGSANAFGSGSRQSLTTMRIELPSVRRIISAMSTSVCFGSTGLRRQPLAAGEGQQLGCQFSATSGRAQGTGDHVAGSGSPSTRDSSSCRFPEMIVSRLLKSCATPPVSLPTASRRCECASCSSVRRRWLNAASRFAIDCSRWSASCANAFG